MDFTSLSPFVRYAAKTGYLIRDTLLIAKDCHILYVLQGTGRFEAEGLQLTLQPHTLIYYPCAVPYRLSGEDNLLFFTINFDFTNRFTQNSQVFVPQKAKDFQPNTAFADIPKMYTPFFSRVHFFTGARWAFGLLQTICEEALHRQTGYKAVQGSCLRQLLIGMVRQSKTTPDPLCETIRSAIAADPCRNIQQLAKILGYHPYYLNEVFRRDCGSSLHKYLQKQRLMKGYEAVTTTRLSIEEIALRCGFCSASHFSSAFHREYGFTPRSLRQCL